eukprot:2687672-Amphidinium_carterae.1
MPKAHTGARRQKNLVSCTQTDTPPCSVDRAPKSSPAVGERFAEQGDLAIEANRMLWEEFLRRRDAQRKKSQVIGQRSGTLLKPAQAPPPNRLNAGRCRNNSSEKPQCKAGLLVVLFPGSWCATSPFL